MNYAIPTTIPDSRDALVPEIVDGTDEEYRDFLIALDKQFPPVSRSGPDFAKIRGDFGMKTAKAIILHMTANRGWSIAEIAETIEATPEMVSRYLADAIRESFPIEDVDIARKFELLKLDEQSRVCKEGLDRSFEDEVSETTTWEDDEGHPVAEGEGTRVTKRTRKGQSGNPAWQRALNDIARHRARLLGLEMPTRVETKSERRELKITHVVVATREEALAAKAAGLLEAPGK